MHTPFGGFATTFAPVGSVSLDSQSPKGSLRIQFLCHPLGATPFLGKGAKICAVRRYHNPLNPLNPLNPHP